MRTLGKYSIGIGDRFGHQAKAQLKAIQLAKNAGVTVIPVWNKSYREHQIIGSQSSVTREQADLAVRELEWQDSYFVDADHINLHNVDFFIDSCDFFTIDVADYIGEPADPAEVKSFVKRYEKYKGGLHLSGIDSILNISRELIQKTAEKYLFAVKQAGEIYRHIAVAKENDIFVIEVSMDETNEAQNPAELFFILAALSDEQIPLQTIAPKFSGRFNKGVDYVGNIDQFHREFEEDVAVLALAVKEFNLPSVLKFSIHSGSDKFSIYPVIREVIRNQDTGLHLKTAGTTWLEELIGLAEAGGEGLRIVKNLYRQSLEHYDELVTPYASVIDIETTQLPDPKEVDVWDGAIFSSTLRHDKKNSLYNHNFRQLMHVAYKMAAQMGERYLRALDEAEIIITKNVIENIYERHIKALFL